MFRRQHEEVYRENESLRARVRELEALVEQMRETLEAISDVRLDVSLPADVACQQARIQMQNLARAGLRLRAVPDRNEDA